MNQPESANKLSLLVLISGERKSENEFVFIESVRLVIRNKMEQIKWKLHFYSKHLMIKEILTYILTKLKIN